MESRTFTTSVDCDRSSGSAASSVRPTQHRTFFRDNSLPASDRWQKVDFRFRGGSLQQPQSRNRIRDRDHQTWSNVAVLAESCFDSGKATFEIIDYLTEICTGDFDNFDALSEFHH